MSSIVDLALRLGIGNADLSDAKDLGKDILLGILEECVSSDNRISKPMLFRQLVRRERTKARDAGVLDNLHRVREENRPVGDIDIDKIVRLTVEDIESRYREHGDNYLRCVNYRWLLLSYPNCYDLLPDDVRDIKIDDYKPISGMIAVRDMDSSVKLGNDSEDRFKRIMKIHGYKVSKSDRDEDMYGHYDFVMSRGSNVWKVDVKSRKRLNRSDGYFNDDKIWIELRNAHGGSGWLDGDADCIAFEQESGYLLIGREKLREFVYKQVDINDVVSDSGEALYRCYSRSGRKDLLTLILYADIFEMGKFYGEDIESDIDWG